MYPLFQNIMASPFTNTIVAKIDELIAALKTSNLVNVKEKKQKETKVPSLDSEKRKFYHTVRAGNFTTAKKMLDQHGGRILSYRDEQGASALTWALYHGIENTNALRFAEYVLTSFLDDCNLMMIEVDGSSVSHTILSYLLSLSDNDVRNAIHVKLLKLVVDALHFRDIVMLFSISHIPISFFEAPETAKAMIDILHAAKCANLLPMFAKAALINRCRPVSDYIWGIWDKEKEMESEEDDWTDDETDYDDDEL